MGKFRGSVLRKSDSIMCCPDDANVAPVTGGEVSPAWEGLHSTRAPVVCSYSQAFCVAASSPSLEFTHGFPNMGKMTVPSNSRLKNELPGLICERIVLINETGPTDHRRQCN